MVNISLVNFGNPSIEVRNYVRLLKCGVEKVLHNASNLNTQGYPNEQGFINFTGCGIVVLNSGSGIKQEPNKQKNAGNYTF